ncbi:cyclic AMP response element-binding protein A isoform X2 [Macrosteles quadrilineatus]|nr:cyclic AMP response element-binding protein A isoform X2 [Macrosteles quadrilineatus]
MSDVFSKGADDDWSSGLLDVKPQVILHDRLMTDAALGTAPIKTEHSYCSLNTSTDSPPDSPLKMEEDTEDECFPPMKLQRRDRSEVRHSEADSDVETEPETEIIIKDEPLSEPDSPMSSCPASPAPPAPALIHRHTHRIHHEQHKLKSGQSLLKQPTAVLMTRSSLSHMVVPTLSIKLEPQNSGFSLPPTPPSSTSSDSEGNVSPSHSHPSSPARRLFLSASNHHSTTSTRQPIQTPLISSQPKGSTGVLLLTEEEKRTLLAEGYPIPTRLPLTKAEEKSLKKIRRKIKNKISAQESRRKKKEYMDALERKVELLSSENSEYRKKINSLEDTNCSLVSQLHKLQAIIARTHNLSPHSRSAK